MCEQRHIIVGETHRFDLGPVGRTAYGDLSLVYREKVPITYIMTSEYVGTLYTGEFFEDGILAGARGKINVTSATDVRRRNRMLSHTGASLRV